MHKRNEFRIFILFVIFGGKYSFLCIVKMDNIVLVHEYARHHFLALFALEKGYNFNLALVMDKE